MYDVVIIGAGVSGSAAARELSFSLPGKMGKGVLVSPTTHGNLIVGPTSTDIADKEGENTTREGLNVVIEKSSMNVKNIPIRQVITSFAGLRAHEDGNEFIIEELEDAKGFIDCVGIESPGLTSAPAIGVMVADILKEKLSLEENPNFVGTRKGILDPNTLSLEERNQLIKEKPEYGNIICRCEMITEGEIIDAIHRPLGAKSVKELKNLKVVAPIKIGDVLLQNIANTGVDIVATRNIIKK